MEKLLESIHLPTGLKELNSAQLKQISEEIREELIECVSESGGHFASSLGATELAVALHHCFTTPEDRLVWDVGHQGYVHKMLTGRRSQMPTIRKKSGLSGFLKRNESVHDAFGAGHAGTSISAAVGMAIALKKKNSSQSVVAIIGDGSLTSGMAFEAMNHAGDLKLNNLIVVLNDNDMSISANVGAISWNFSKALTSKTSTKARAGFKDLYKKGYVPELLYKTIDRVEEVTQNFFSSPSMLFEAFGFRYIGPVDGHNIDDIITAIENAKTQDIPVVIHAKTKKGKGYNPAEADPIKWHGVTPFDRKNGVFKKGKQTPPSYTEVFSSTAIKLANEDNKVIAITAAMASGTGLDKFQNEHPEKFFDVGICEQHAVTCAAGLACEGYKPICTIYSTFLQRAYDQVLHDVCIQNLPVLFAMDRSGVVGNDGETHQGVFDLSFLRTIPNMVIASPKDENELQHLLYTGIQHNGPFAVRYPRGSGTGVALDTEFKKIPIGKAEVVQEGKDLLFICLGPMVQNAIEATKELESIGVTSTIINARFAKPLDKELLAKHLPKYGKIAIIEDHVIAGGFSSAIIELINDQQIRIKGQINRFGVGDHFIPHATQAEQIEEEGYSSSKIVEFYQTQFKTRKLVALG